MQTEYKHIYFDIVEVEPKRKTQVWECRTNEDDFLGEVKWYSPWRQYCFFTEQGIVLAKSCIDDISHFVGQLKK